MITRPLAAVIIQPSECVIIRPLSAVIIRNFSAGLHRHKLPSGQSKHAGPDSQTASDLNELAVEFVFSKTRSMATLNHIQCSTLVSLPS